MQLILMWKNCELGLNKSISPTIISTISIGPAQNMIIFNVGNACFSPLDLVHILS